MLDSPGGCRKEAAESEPIVRRSPTVSRGGERRVKGVELTDRQALALSIIRRSLKERGRPPTKAEIAAGMEIKNGSVDKHLIALERKGWVDVSRSTSRGIRLLREGAPLVDQDELPTVAAGAPMLAEDRAEPTRLHDFDSFAGQFEARPDWFVRVTGDSMDKVGFRTGDILAVRRQPEARNGDVVIARIGADITLKRYERTGKTTVELQPVSTNDGHDAIEIGPTTTDVEIVGVVVGAIVGTRRGAHA